MPDILNQLGPVALGSRLRRLTDRITQDVVQIYKEQNIDFEPRWFPVFYLLSKKSPVCVGDIAKEVGISHPAVNQIAGELIKKGLVKASKCGKDKRKRLLELTPKGEAMLPELQEIWETVRIAVREMVDGTGVDVLGMLDKLDASLDERDIYQRFVTHSKSRQMASVEVFFYEPQYAEDFKRLNEEWISKYFHIEPQDVVMLGNPQREIIDKGGEIIYARDNGEIVGTCALLKVNNRIFELAKMAVTEKAQGRQIGKKLLAAAIEKAREMGADVLVLGTNSSLTPAINLYRKLGFVVVPHDSNHVAYERADVCMRLEL